MRVNITLNEEIRDWYNSEAKRIGVSASSLMALALDRYMRGDDFEKRIVDIEKTLRKFTRNDK